MTTLSIDSADTAETAASLPGRVLKAGGVIGLIAFLLVGALIAIVWRGLGSLDALASEQQHTKAAVVQHVADSQADREFARKLAVAQCKMLAKLSKSDPELCEVGR